jgi:hypothetical protein
MKFRLRLNTNPRVDASLRIAAGEEGDKVYLMQKILIFM